MAERVYGLPPVDAALAFTARGPRILARREAEAALARNPDASGLAALLTAAGWIARPVKVEPGFLDRVEGDTLVEAAEGGWLLLRPRRDGGFLVAEPEGARRVCARAEVESALGAWALETRPAPAEGLGLYGRVLGGLLRQRSLLTRLLLASLLLQGLALLVPQATRLALDQALPSGARSLLALVALGLALLALFQAWTGWLRQRAVLHLETRVEAELGHEFIGHVLSLPFATLQQHRLGELLQAREGLDAARDLFTTSVLGNLMDGLMACFTLAVMAGMMAGPTLAVLLLSLVLVGLVIGVGRVQEGLMRRRVAAQVAEQGYLVELLKGVATVKAAGAEAKGFERWVGLLATHLRLNLGHQRVGLWHEVGLDGLRQGASVLVLVWGGRLVLAGELQVGALMAFAMLASTYLGGVLGLAQAYLTWRAVRPQLARTEALMAQATEAAAIPGTGAPLDGAIEVEDLWFRYGPDLPWVLKGYTLRVEPGEKRWIHAPSGFGKTTLLRVLAGLCAPERGAVRLGGRSPAEAKGHLVYLPQSTQLYGASILENLRLLSGGAETSRLLEAARTSGLETFVKDLPMGYHTVVAPGGGNLSGGQRQLVALTAAMASEARLLLLDEAMANLDWATKRWLHDSPWFEGKTVIYASHDAGLG